MSNESSDQKKIVTAKDLRSQVAEGQALADKGRGKCQVCHTVGPLAKCLTCWKDGYLAFSICERCMGTHLVIMEMTIEGYRIKATKKNAITVS